MSSETDHIICLLLLLSQVNYARTILMSLQRSECLESNSWDLATLGTEIFLRTNSSFESSEFCRWRKKHLQHFGVFPSYLENRSETKISLVKLCDTVFCDWKTWRDVEGFADIKIQVENVSQSSAMSRASWPATKDQMNISVGCKMLNWDFQPSLAQNLFLCSPQLSALFELLR